MEPEEKLYLLSFHNQHGEELNTFQWLLRTLHTLSYGLEQRVRCCFSSRDFLDLEAESVCSSALAAFGSQASAPTPTDYIDIDAFIALARQEAAALDLAELELRQAVRMQGRNELATVQGAIHGIFSSGIADVFIPSLLLSRNCPKSPQQWSQTAAVAC